MFWSKIWFFLVALAAAVAITIALVMPRPAERTHRHDEHQRLTVACNVVGILLTDNARNRILFVSKLSRVAPLINRIEEASKLESINATFARDTRELAAQIVEGEETLRPDFAMIIDKQGRVVARVKMEEDVFGDVAAGRPLVDDALDGHLGDDVWMIGGRLFLVAAAPVIRTDGGISYAGAVVVGHAVSNSMAQRLVSSLDVGISFFARGEAVASHPAVNLDRDILEAARAKLTNEDISGDCAAQTPVNLRSGRDEHTAVIARVPGEAARAKTFYSIFISRPKAIGFSGTLAAVTKADLSFANFPWLPVGGAFLIALLVGMGLMLFETDLPLRRLAADAVGLAKGEKERLAEDKHRGKFGSVARSININIDKVQQDAKNAKKDLDQLLGPSDALGALDLLAAIPERPAVPAGPASASASSIAVSAAPSEFKFSDPAIVAPPTAAPAPLEFALPPSQPKEAAKAAPPAKPKPPVPTRVTPPPMKVAKAPEPAHEERAEPQLGLGHELGSDDVTMAGPPLEELVQLQDEATFRDVFEQFIALKKECGEPTTGLTFERFADKLRRNRDDLRDKTGCKEVKFAVYVKEGKAALKASPVKS